MPPKNRAGHPPKEKKADDRTGIRPEHALAAILLIATAMRAWNLMGDLGVPRGFGDGYNAYAAREVLNGKTPYADFTYTHVPLLPYAIAATYGLLGSGLLQARIFNLSVNLLSTIPLYLITKKWFGQKEALLASFLWAVYPHVITSARYVGHESLMTLLILLSVLAITERKAFASGAMLGLATLAKEPAILMLIPFWVVLRKSGKDARLWALGLAAVTIPVLAYFTIAGGENFIPYNLRFHAALPQQEIGNKISVFLMETYRYNAYSAESAARGLLVIAFSTLGLWKTAKSGREGIIFMAGWMAAGALLLLNKGFWWHYPMQLMPPLLAFTSSGMLHAAKGRGAYAYLAAALMLILLIHEDYGIITKRDDSQALAAEALKKLTGRNDAVMTTMLAIPLLADRTVPGRLTEFGYQNALITSEYAIGTAEKENVSAIVMDGRITEKRAERLEKFRDYVKSNYRKAWRMEYEYWGAKDEISIWVKGS